MSRNKQKRKLIIVSVIAILFFIIIGYAGYNSILKLNASYSISENFEVKITDIQTKTIGGHAVNNSAPTFDGTTATFDAKLYLPGDYIEYRVVLTNTGNVDTVFESVEEVEDIGSALIFSYSGIEAGDALPANSEKTITIRVEYDINVTEQPEVLANKFDLTINFVEGKGNINVDVEEVLPPITIAELKNKVVTSGDGLYADTYEAGRYVYKGASPDNYIWLDLNGDSTKTDNETYRIMSVEADNTIKVVAQNSLGNMAWDSSGNRTASGYCTSTYCNAWGSSSTTLNASGNNVTVMPIEAGNSTTYALPTNEASLNTYLNTTFLNGINSNLQNKIATHTFNIGPLKGASDQTLATDISQESAYKWSGKIALINATDYVKASTNTSCINVYAYCYTQECYNNSTTHNYLFHSQYEWTLSPRSLSDDSAFVWYVASDGDLPCNGANISYHGVWPSFYLTSDISLSGEGTSSVPYEIG